MQKCNYSQEESFYVQFIYKDRKALMNQAKRQSDALQSFSLTLVFEEVVCKRTLPLDLDVIPNYLDLQLETEL